jgi:hypothetical protein
VVDYVSKLKKRWSSPDFNDPVELECGKYYDKYKNGQKESESEIIIFNGLNPRFENKRAALYGSGKVSGLEQVVSDIVNKETRQKVEAGEHVYHLNGILYS